MEPSTSLRRTWTYRTLRWAIREPVSRAWSQLRMGNQATQAAVLGGTSSAGGFVGFGAAHLVDFVGNSPLGPWLATPAMLGSVIALSGIGVLLALFTPVRTLGVLLTVAALFAGIGAPVAAAVAGFVLPVVLAVMALEWGLRRVLLRGRNR